MVTVTFENVSDTLADHVINHFIFNKKKFHIDAMSAALKHGIVKSAVKASFDIYCKRNYADSLPVAT